LSQHDVAPALRPLGVTHRVVVGGALQHPHQRGGLQGVELSCRLVEVGPGGHLDADHVVEERRAVEVRLQDLLLAEVALDPKAVAISFTLRANDLSRPISCGTGCARVAG
jgi:hypothetical protein